MKEFADNNFGRTFSKRAEGTVERGEISRYCVFKRLLLHTCKNQSTDSTEGQEIEDMRQHKRSDKVNLNIRPSTVTLTLDISN